MVEIGIVMFSKVVQSENSKKKLERGADPCQGPNMHCPAKYARQKKKSQRNEIIHEMMTSSTINQSMNLFPMSPGNYQLIILSVVSNVTRDRALWRSNYTQFFYFYLLDDVITRKCDTRNGQKLFYNTIQSIFLSMKYHSNFGKFLSPPSQAYKFPKVDVKKKVFLANIRKI